MRKVLLGCALAAVLAAGFIVLRSTAESGSGLAAASEILETENARIEVGGNLTAQNATVKISGAGIASPDPYRAKVEFKYETADGVVEWTAIKAGEERFLPSPQLAEAMPSAKRWLRATDVPGAADVMVPSDFGGFLERAENVEKLEASELRGQRVTHYRGVISSQEVVDGFEERSKEFAETMVSERPVTVDAWLDDDDRPLRLAVEMHQIDGGVVKTSVDILEYGVPVDVKPPPAAEVAEQSELKQS